jgi:hypothetical protein
VNAAPRDARRGLGVPRESFNMRARTWSFPPQDAKRTRVRARNETPDETPADAK